MALADVAGKLAEVLASEPCAQEWLPHTGRRRGVISQAAVAQVLADYLWDAGLADEHNRQLPRQLKDRVGRALRGEAISAETLGWFTRAFPMDPEETDDLWRLFGELETEEELAEGPPRRTISLHEYHYLGPTGLPHHHQTIQLVKALEDGLSSYDYIIDTDEVEVEVERGGRAAELTRRDDGLYTVRLLFHRPLRRGEFVTLRYNTIFHYSASPEPNLRRQSRRRVENMELNVQFHEHKLPARLWWATWEALDRSVVDREAVALDNDRSASRYVSAVTNKIIGFEWEW